MDKIKTRQDLTEAGFTMTAQSLTEEVWESFDQVVNVTYSITNHDKIKRLVGFFKKGARR